MTKMNKGGMDDLTSAMSSLEVVPTKPRGVKPPPRRVTKRQSGRVIKPLFRRINDRPWLFPLYAETVLSSSPPKQSVPPKDPPTISQNIAKVQPTKKDNQHCATTPFLQALNESPKPFSSNMASIVEASQERKIKPLPRRFNKKIEQASSNPQPVAETIQRRGMKPVPPGLLPCIPPPDLPLAPPEPPTECRSSQSQVSSLSSYAERIIQIKAAAKARLIDELQIEEKRNKLRTAGQIVSYKKEILELEKPDLAVDDYNRQEEALKDKSANLRSETVALDNRLRAKIEQTPELVTLRAWILQVNLRRSPIMRLSSEIRVSIFEYSIGNTLIHVSREGFGICNAFDKNLLRETFDRLTSDHLDEHTPSDRFESLGALPSLAILRVCRQFYSDARDIVWKQYLFDIRWVNSFMSHLNRKFPTNNTTPTLDMSKIRRLCLQSSHGKNAWHWIPNEMEVWQDFCVTASQQMTSLRELRVGFSLVCLNMKEARAFCTLDHAWAKALLKFRQPKLTVVELIPYDWMEDVTKKGTRTHKKLIAFGRELEKALLARESTV